MSKNICPFLKKACIEHDCMLYTHVTYVNPQSGIGEDKYACSIALVPVMLIENARKTGGVQSAVENARNEICERQDTFNKLAIAAVERKQLEG